MKKNDSQSNESFLFSDRLTLGTHAKSKRKNRNEEGSAGVNIVYRKSRFSKFKQEGDFNNTEKVELCVEVQDPGGGKKTKQRRLMDKYISVLAAYYPVLTTDCPSPITKNFRQAVFEDVKLRSLPLTEKDVVRGLRAYVSSSLYHSAILNGQWRYNIHGEPVEKINDADKAYAGKMLKMFGRKRK